MLSQLSGKEETDSSLDFSGGDGGPLVVVSKSGSLSGDSLEDIVHEAVHDAHGTAGDASIWMHLLQDFVDVNAVAFLSASAPLSCSTGGRPASLSCFLRTFTACFRRHVYCCDRIGV